MIVALLSASPADLAAALLARFAIDHGREPSPDDVRAMMARLRAAAGELAGYAGSSSPTTTTRTGPAGGTGGGEAGADERSFFLRRAQSSDATEGVTPSAAAGDAGSPGSVGASPQGSGASGMGAG